ASQATVLALQAIVAFEATRSRPKHAGVIQVLIDGAPCVTAPFGADVSAPMPYTLRVRASTLEAPSAPLCKVALATSLDRAELPEGETIELRAVLANV